MKKLTVIILALLIAFNSLGHAGQLSIGMGNDTFSFGLADDRDDQNTYSLHVAYEDQLEDTSTYKVGIDYTPYTLRPITFTNEKGELVEASGRVDLIDAYLEAKRNFLGDDSRFYSKARLGFSLKGNFGGEFNQNLIHKALNLKEVHLPYEGYSINYVLGTAIGFSMPANTFTTVFGETGLLFNGNVKMNLTCGVNFGRKSYIRVFTGYDIDIDPKQAFTATPIGRANYYNTGANFGFEIDGEVFHINFKAYTDNLNGYGIVTINPFAEKTYEETDLTFSYGRMMLGHKTCNSVIVRKDFEGGSFIFKDDFYTEVYQKAPYQGLDSYTSFEVGFRLGETFYAQTSVGGGRFFTEDHASTYITDPTKETNFFVTGTLEFGYNLPFSFIMGNTKVGVETFIAGHFMSDTSWTERCPDWNGLNIEGVTPQVGFRINLGLDM